MEKDNKYYEIIKNLVENHKKFSGYEEILDDIIEDVFEHSKAVVASITDDGVIESYLAKVVNTSMITVPKKLGLKKRIEVVPTPLPELPKAEEIKVNTEYIDKMINGASSYAPKDEFQPVETTETAESVESPEDETVEIANEYIEPETIETAEEIPTVENIEQETPSADIDVESFDSGNGEASEIQDFEPEKTEEISDEDEKEVEPADIFAAGIEPDAVNEYEAAEENTDSQFDDVVSLDLDLDNQESDVIGDDEEKFDTIDTIELVDADDVEEASAPTEIEPQTQDSFADVLELSESEQLPQVNEFELQSDEVDELSEVSFEEDLLPSGDMTQDAEIQSELYEDDTLVEMLGEDDEKPSLNSDVEHKNEHKIIDFSAFEAQGEAFGETDYIDKETIQKDLGALISEREDLAQIYDLKYKQNMGIQEIASALNITENAVAEALKEIIEVL